MSGLPDRPAPAKRRAWFPGVSHASATGDVDSSTSARTHFQSYPVLAGTLRSRASACNARSEAALTVRTDLTKVGQGMLMTRQVELDDAKARLAQLVEAAAGGEEIIIAKAGKPLAKLVPYRTTNAARQPGAWRGRVKIAPDFDA